jgi:cytochrome c oxidase subunit 1
MGAPSPAMKITWWGWSGLRTPLLFAVGAIAALTLAIGTLIGIAIPHPGTDRALHDTYYVVAHSTYILKLAALFGVFAVWYFAFPRITGWSYSDFLGKLHFSLTVTGVGALIIALSVMSSQAPRVANDPDFFWRWNLVSSIGSYLIVAGVMVFVANMVLAVVRRRQSF